MSPEQPSPVTLDQPSPRSWTVRLRNRIRHTVPEGQWLPDRQPAYVRSWIYVFGVATLAALLFVLASGLALTLGGPTWWHTSSVGHFFNSMHLWSVELFFIFMVIHLWGMFFMAAWRGKRGLTWVTGAVAFVGSIGTAFTGYLSQTNFDSQWISTQAKDGLNAVAVGAVFNVLNTGQMLLWHIMLLPLLVGILVVAHLILVRRRGVVPPFDAVPPGQAEPAPSATEREPVPAETQREPVPAETQREPVPAEAEREPVPPRAEREPAPAGTHRQAVRSADRTTDRSE